MQRANLLTLLEGRGIDRAARLLAAVPDGELEGVAGAIEWYDERRRQSGDRVGAGLLVNCIREGGKPGYRAAGAEAVLPVTPKLLNAVRGRCLSPDGCRRSEVLDMFAEAAGRRGVTVSELVDQAVGPHWDLTPPHPGRVRGEGQMRRYNDWLADRGPRPDVTVVRFPGETVLSWSMRFWQTANREEVGNGQDRDR